MLAAMNGSIQVVAGNVTKKDGPFFCPECNGEVLVKKGTKKVHHFAHIPPTTCVYGEGETELHRKAKMELFQALSQYDELSEVQLERGLGEVRPDVSFVYNNTLFAIEVQASNLDWKEISRRTSIYQQKGIPVLWTPPYLDNMFKKRNEDNLPRYTPKLWEKYLHAMYFGKVFYWLRGEELKIIKFGEHMISTEEYYEYATGSVYGGHTYRSIKFRTPQVIGETKVTELEIKKRPFKALRDFSLPEALLLGKWT